MANDQYQGYSNTDFARTVQTTMAKHFRTVEEAMMRDFKILALLQSGGRVMKNLSGRGFDWNVQYRLHDLEGNTGETQRNFIRKNLWKKAYLDYRGYQATDAIYYRETRENRGAEALIKVFEGMVGRLEKSMQQGLAREFWIDGNASGNEQSWHGIESFFGANGTINSSTGAQRSANAADFVAYPSDTYAGLSTILGNYDGENESGQVWPNGVADPEYDFWSPIHVNAKCTGFTPSTHTWVNQGHEVMRFAIIHSQRNQVANEITHIFLARDWYYELLNLLDDKERIVITPELSLRQLGFRNVVGFDGLEVTWEASIAASRGYGINMKNVSLCCLDEQMLRTEGPEYDIKTQSWGAVVSTLSNLKFESPRNFFKMSNIA